MLTRLVSRVHDIPGFQKVIESIHEFLSQERVLGALTVGPALTLFFLITIVPIGWAIAASFYRVPAFRPEWTYVGLENFGIIISDSGFRASLVRGVIFAGGSVFVQVTFGVAFALVLNKSFRFNKIVRAIALVPYLIPTVILGFIALWMGNQQWGILNQLLINVGLIESRIAWFSDKQTAMIALVLTNSWKFSLFVTIMVLARLQGIPEGFYEAARVAGASSYQMFRDITLPNLKNVLFIVLLLRGVWMFNKFDIIWVLTRGGPSHATETPPVFAYKEAFQFQSLGRAAAVSTLLFIILVVAAIIYFVVLKPSEEVRVE